MTPSQTSAYARDVFFRALPLVIGCSIFSIACASRPTPPPTPATVTVPAAPESNTPEVTAYHCDGNPFHIGDKDYCAYDIPATWREAQRACNAISARLLSFSSEEHARSIAEAFGSAIEISTEAYWIGLHELEDEEGSWQWLDGKKVTYTHWNNGEPNDTGQEEDCAEWKLGLGAWNDAPCWAYRKYICQQRGNASLTCDGTRLKLASTEYCFSAEALGWGDAKQVCHDYGGELANLSTQELDSRLHKAVGPRLGLPSIWIGYTDSAREGEWKWVSGSRFAFDAWKYGEPNDFHDEDCAQWFPEDGQMNDYACSARLPYVCERIE